jgi:alpha-tubulin suppressor-like RCC1 family protein
MASSSPIVSPFSNSSIIYNATIVKTAVSHTTSHILTNRGAIYSWGSVSFTIVNGNANRLINALGVGYFRVSSPTLVSITGETFVDICAGFGHVAALTQSNKLFFWGTITTNSGSVLMNSSLPQAISLTLLGINKPTNIYCTYSSIIVLDNAYNLYSIGRNTTLGIGSTQDSTVLTTITFFTGTPSITIASGSLNTVLVLRSDGSMITWGSNSNSQIGDNVSPNP